VYVQFLILFGLYILIFSSQFLSFFYLIWTLLSELNAKLNSFTETVQFLTHPYYLLCLEPVYNICRSDTDLFEAYKLPIYGML